MKRVIIAIVFLLVFLATLDQLILQKETADKTNQNKPSETEKLLDYGPNVGDLAPNFTLKTLDGQELSLQNFFGKKILLNFWASWCGPCLQEIPHIQDVYEKSKETDIVVLTVNLTFGKETEEVVRNFVKERELTFPVLLDQSGKVMKEYEVISIPTSYFINTNGVIQHKYIGPMNEKYINKIFKQMN